MSAFEGEKSKKFQICTYCNAKSLKYIYIFFLKINHIDQKCLIEQIYIFAQKRTHILKT